MNKIQEMHRRFENATAASEARSFADADRRKFSRVKPGGFFWQTFLHQIMLFMRVVRMQIDVYKHRT